MNPEVKVRWIDKLENGDIPQTTGKLGDVEGGRCCLGVLCDIAVQDGVISAPSVDYDGRLMYAKEVAVLPPEVMEWAGIERSNGGFSTDPEKDDPEYMDDALSYRNDCGMSFPEIAKIIRERF